MDTPSSPSLSTVSFGEDEWDLISGGSESVGHLSPSAPASTAGDSDSDGERGVVLHTEEFNDLAMSTGDELEVGDVDDAVLRESDRRVEAALASSLSSTLEPFRQPLPAYLTRSISSSMSSGLVLSFPDPLTPSLALFPDPSTPFLTLDTTNTAVDDNAAQVDESRSKEQSLEVSPVAEPTKAPEGSAEVLAAPPAPIEAPRFITADHTLEQVAQAMNEAGIKISDRAVSEETSTTEEVITSKRDAKDLRKIASYVRRRKSDGSKRRLSAGSVAHIFNGPAMPHSLTTAIVLSVLAILLGSALLATRSYMMLSLKGVAAPRPSLRPLSTIDAHVTGVLTDHVGAKLPTTTILLETPGAGPSVISTTTGHRGTMSSTKMSGTTGDLTSAPKLGTHVGSRINTGLSSLPAWSAPAATQSCFWSKSKGKGKEREVINVWDYHGAYDNESSEEKQATLLLDGPGLPASFGRALQGLKATVMAHHQSLSTDLLALPGLDWLANFEQVLDALLARILVQTSSLLQDLSSIVTNQASAILASAPVQSAREKIVRHHERVWSRTERIARAVHAHHRRAKANAKKCSQSVEESLRAVKEHATDLSVRMDVRVKAHHQRVRQNVQKGRLMVETGFRDLVDGGQRLLVDTFGGDREFEEEAY